MNEAYESRWFFEQSAPLNPKIIHINCDPNIDDEAIMMINKMVEIAFTKIK